MSSDNRPRLVLYGHDQFITALALSPDGEAVASIDRSGTVIVWDVASGAMQGRFSTGHMGIESLQFGPGGKLSAISQHHIEQWDVPRRKRGKLASQEGPSLLPPALSLDGRTAALGNGGAVGAVEINLHRWPGGRRLPTLRSGLVKPSSMLLCADGSRLVVMETGDPGSSTVEVWDVAAGIPLVPPTPVEGPFHTAHAGADHLLLAGQRGVLRLDYATRKVHPGPELDWGDFNLPNTFTPDGRLLLTASVVPMEGQYKLALWDVADGRELWRARLSQGWQIIAAFSAQGARIALVEHDRQIGVYATHPLQVLAELGRPPRDVAEIAFSPSGDRLLCGGEGGLQVWDTGTGRLRNLESRPDDTVASLTVLADGQRFAAITSVPPSSKEVSHGRELAVRDLDSGEAVWRKTIPGGGGLQTALGGRALLAWVGGVVRLWNAANGRSLGRFAVPGYPMVVSPDGMRLAVAVSPDGDALQDLGYPGIDEGDSTTRFAVAVLYELPTGRLLARVEGEHWQVPAESLVFSPDGKTLALGGRDYWGGLWDLSDRGELRKLEVPDDGVGALAYSPDGRTLAIALDYSPFVSLAPTGRGRTIALRPGGSGVRAIAFSPDGSQFATASSNGEVQLWEPGTGQLRLTMLMLPPIQPGAEEGWIAWTPDGLYTGSDGAEQFTRWEVDGQLLPGETYRERFRRERL